MLLTLREQVHQARFDLLFFEELALANDRQNVFLLHVVIWTVFAHRCELEDWHLLLCLRFLPALLQMLIECLTSAHRLVLYDWF